MGSHYDVMGFSSSIRGRTNIIACPASWSGKTYQACRTHIRPRKPKSRPAKITYINPEPIWKHTITYQTNILSTSLLKTYWHTHSFGNTHLWKLMTSYNRCIAWFMKTYVKPSALYFTPDMSKHTLQKCPEFLLTIQLMWWYVLGILCVPMKLWRCDVCVKADLQPYWPLEGHRNNSDLCTP